jgi:hypothetical protein
VQGRRRLGALLTGSMVVIGGKLGLYTYRRTERTFHRKE